MEERNLRKTRTGRVVSNKMDKTIVVAVEDNVKHPLYNLSMQRKSARRLTDSELRLWIATDRCTRWLHP